MEYRMLADKGPRLSVLGYGCMRFPQNSEGKIDEEQALALLEKAYEAGVNYYDTAWVYHNGESEEFLGRAFVPKHPRDSFYLATKLPCWEVESLEDARRIFEEQLRKLNTEYIDFYLLHALGRERFQKMAELGVPELLLEWKREGRIRHLGFSFHDGYEAFEEIVNYWDEWDFCQIQFNYMDRHEQAGLKGIALAREKNIPLVIMEPIKGGSLAALPEDICGPFQALSPLASTASWALRYVASFEGVKVILSGMSAMEQVMDNLNTFDGENNLSQEEMKTVLDVAERLRLRTRNGCTGCNYCMPCPAGVNIPRNFAIWNTYYKYQNKGGSSWQWNQEMPGEQKGINCVKCGKCEELCPQKISIREDLKRATEELDHIWD